MKVYESCPLGRAREIKLSMSPEEARGLADDLAAAGNVCADEGHAALTDRLMSLARELRAGLAAPVPGAPPLTPVEVAARAVSHESLPPMSAIMEANTFKGIPREHVEWALKVHRLTASHVRATPHASLERTFPDEAAAKEFFTRTQNVWNARVNGGEAPAFEVLLGVQDARKHRKKGSFREVDRALCTGGVR